MESSQQFFKLGIKGTLFLPVIRSKKKGDSSAGKIMEQARDTDITKTLSDGIQELMAIEDIQLDEDNGELQPISADLFKDFEKDHC